MSISSLGIDLAKNVFQLHGTNDLGKVVLTKRLSRAKLPKFVAKLSPCLIGMEACGSANYWARKFKSFGHEVKLISPQFVKPYVKTNKNDFNDAEAICEAVTRPNMRFVPIKKVSQQDMQSLHRIRSQLIQSRTAKANQVRGLLAEYGIVIPKDIHNVRKMLPIILEDVENELSCLMRRELHNLYTDLLNLDNRIEKEEIAIKEIYNSNESCKRISEIEGIGMLTATAVVSAIGDPSTFKNGRAFSAWLGLVPKQSSSGNKQMLLGISKRGDKYLRSLLVHGARSVVYRANSKSDKRSIWISELKKRRGANKTCVAVANKNARIIWAVLSKNEEYRKAA
jgi:transposase